MRRPKLFFTAVFTLLVFLCVITVFLPSEITVSKSVFINANENKVAMQIEDFNNWKNWYPAFQNKNINVITSTSGDSSFAMLTNENRKKLAFSMGKRLADSINVLLSEEGKNNIIYQFILSTNVKGQTLFIWNIKTTLGWYPWKKLTGIFLDKITGPEYEAILQSLKITVEKNVH